MRSCSVPFFSLACHTPQKKNVKTNTQQRPPGTALGRRHPCTGSARRRCRRCCVRLQRQSVQWYVLTWPSFSFFWGGEAGVAWLAGGAAAGDGQVVRPPTYPRPSSFFKIKKKKIVDGGHRAVKFSRVYGVTNDIYSEGTHFRIPWFETPIIYDVRAKPRNIASLTGSKGASCLFSYPIDLFFPPSQTCRWSTLPSVCSPSPRSTSCPPFSAPLARCGFFVLFNFPVCLLVFFFLGL